MQCDSRRPRRGEARQGEEAEDDTGSVHVGEDGTRKGESRSGMNLKGRSVITDLILRCLH